MTKRWIKNTHLCIRAGARAIVGAFLPKPVAVDLNVETGQLQVYVEEDGRLILKPVRRVVAAGRATAASICQCGDQVPGGMLASIDRPTRLLDPRAWRSRPSERPDRPSTRGGRPVKAAEVVA